MSAIFLVILLVLAFVGNIEAKAYEKATKKEEYSGKNETEYCNAKCRKNDSDYGIEYERRMKLQHILRRSSSLMSRVLPGK